MVDEAKLQRLRERYRDAPGGVMYDPHFSAVAESQFTGGDRRKWPFADVPTLLGAPYRGEIQKTKDFSGLDFALIGVPMDLGVTNRAGARIGPRAVRGGRAHRTLRACAAHGAAVARRASPTSATC